MLNFNYIYLMKGRSLFLESIEDVFYMFLNKLYVVTLFSSAYVL